MNKRNMLYHQGSEKLNNELDWISIINSIRELRVLIQLNIAENQKELIKFHNNNLLQILDKNKINQK